MALIGANSSNNGGQIDGNGAPLNAAQSIHRAQEVQQVALLNNNLLPLNLRLDQSNYTFWRSLVLAATRAYNLEGYILGTIPPPPQILKGNIPNPDFLQWQRFDQFLIHWLMNSISEQMLGHVINCQSSSEVWNFFAQLFASRSRVRILQIRGLLQATKKGSSTIEEYTLKMKSFPDALAAADQQISDDDLILYILGGLGQEYEAAIVNLTSRENPLSLQEVQFMLHSHELRLHQHTTETLSNVQANLANMSTSNNNGGGYNGRGQRFNNRGGRGYSSNRGGRGNRPICQLCGKAGHTAQKCYHRFDITYTGPTSSSNSSNETNAENPQANLVETPSTSDISGAWFLDTGATHHMTTNSHNLQNPMDYKGKAKVVVGNGNSMPIFRIGSNSISSNLPNQFLILKDILHVPNATKNLLSISQFTKDNNFTLEFNDVCCLIKDKTTRQVLLKGTLNNGLYKLQIQPVKIPSQPSNRVQPAKKIKQYPIRP
uniref:CCHC-type domain-containing protein n=1 Tax=Cannabis sativa TaxID=3483 RepID=A0A803Q8Y1_CANSA